MIHLDRRPFSVRLRARPHNFSGQTIWVNSFTYIFAEGLFIVLLKQFKLIYW